MPVWIVYVVQGLFLAAKLINIIVTVKAAWKVSPKAAGDLLLQGMDLVRDAVLKGMPGLEKEYTLAYQEREMRRAIELQDAAEEAAINHGGSHTPPVILADSDEDVDALIIKANSNLPPEK